MIAVINITTILLFKLVWGSALWYPFTRSTSSRWGYQSRIFICCLLFSPVHIGVPLNLFNFHKKKTPISRGLFLVLPNQVFPCFHCFSKTSPTHTNTLCHIFPFRGRGWVILLNCHICQLYLFRLNRIKKHPNSYESRRLVSEISVWGVSDVFNLMEKISIDWSIYTIFNFLIMTE